MVKSLAYREPHELGLGGSTNGSWSGSDGDRARNMDIRDFILVLRNRLWWIALMTVACVGASVVITMGMTPVYSAKSTLFVTVDSSQDTAYARGQFALQRVGSYPQLINDPKLINEVISTLNLDRTFQEVKSSLTATNPVDTVLISVTAKASSGKEAAAIANTAAPLLAEAISKLENSDPKKLMVKAELSVPASAPQFPIAPRKSVNLGLGLISGLSLGLLLALTINKLDPRILRARDVERQTSIPVLGTVPDLQTGGQRRKHDKGELGYRELISNLLMVNDGRLPHRILLLGDRRESVIDARKLATALAALGKRAVIVEGDEHAPAMVAGDTELPGLGQVLSGKATLAEATQHIDSVPMGYLSAGAKDDSLRNFDVYSRLEPVIGKLEAEYDVVIMTSALGASPIDATVVALHSDCVLVACRERKTTYRQIKRTVQELNAVRVGTTGLLIVEKRKLFRRNLRS